MVTTFAGGHAKVLGDVNPKNFKEMWAKIHFGGATEIVPGWNTMLLNYIDEFAEKDASKQPLKLVTLITDGEADDLKEFMEILKKDKDAYVCVILIGCQYGDQNHQTAIDQFTALAETNHRVVFRNFSNCVDPQLLANEIMLVCNQAAVA